MIYEMHEKKNFRALILKNLNGVLENVELQELNELKLQKTSPVLAKELAQINQMEQIVKAHEELMSHFQHLTQKDGNDVI